MGQGLGSRIRKLYTAFYEFITEKGIETHEEAQASRLHRFAHFWLLVFKSFSRNRCPLRATALAYTTLLALIPLLAVSFGIISSVLREKGPNATKDLLEQFVDAAVPQLKLIPPEEGKPKPREEAIQRLEELINNANSTTLGLTGFIGLIFVAILLLATIEGTFNDIWGVTRGRTWFRRVGQYWAMISLGPIALVSVVYLAGTSYGEGLENLVLRWSPKEHNRVAVTFDHTTERIILPAHRLAVNDRINFRDSASLPLELNTASWYYVQSIVDPSTVTIAKAANVGSALAFTSDGSRVRLTSAEERPFLSLVSKSFVKALPFILVSIIFALLYKIMPNTQVKWRAALMGGIVGGSLWLLLNIFNALNVSRVVSMSKIYGTALGIIPIFLIGLYFSWLIMLFGAQVAYAFQNRDVYLQEKKAESVNQRNREYVALRVMTLLAQRFDCGQKPPSVLEIATELAVPSRLIGRVLQPLIEAGLVLEVATARNEVAYAPSRPTETITCHDILQTLRSGGGQELETRDEHSRPVVCAQFEKIEEAERRAAAAVTLKDLVNQIPAVLAPGREHEIKWRAS